jgi:hypothetical protein
VCDPADGWKFPPCPIKHNRSHEENLQSEVERPSAGKHHPTEILDLTETNDYNCPRRVEPVLNERDFR